MYVFLKYKLEVMLHAFALQILCSHAEIVFGNVYTINGLTEALSFCRLDICL